MTFIEDDLVLSKDGTSDGSPVVRQSLIFHFPN